MLKINNVSIEIAGKRIIDSLNTSFNKGEVNTIYGLNGIGKTTLFNCIYGLLKYTGSITLDNRSITKDDCSYLMTENYFYPNLLACEYLNIFQNNSKSELFKIDMLAELLGVPLKQNIDTFSTGMKKKLSFIAVIKLNREVFLLDEPFNGVDYESIILMKEIIKKLIENSKMVIISSHIQSHIIDICENILVIEDVNQHNQLSKQKFESYLLDISTTVSKRIQDALM
ncbi:ATP-binding cassette domain-containing protein [Hydrotalea sp.]|uniref:ATP-binding cassette domain-containing protein n=1 Tax=Hydrotalea sp. TaxID=2881279 RepID=UPI002622B16B|nr:ATP-binding cassette domain-containing protein [Hydrotalea sp.]